jgi:hypothetical protein
MTTSLKRLLEQEAARTDIPPAPVDAVVTGGRARVRRWRVVCVAAAAAAAVLSIAIPIGLTQGDSDNQPVEPPEKHGWRQMDGPWTDLRSIHFGAATVARPPGWNVEVLTSTRDSALYTTPINNGATYRLYEVRPDESVHAIGSDVIGTPFADPAGSYVAWQEKAAGEIVVYDTSRGSELARQSVGGDAYVIAVDGDTVTYADADQTYTWRPGHDPEWIDPSILNRGTVTDVDADLRLVSSLGGPGDSYVVDSVGRGALTLPGQVYGEFDPSGRYLALTRLTGPELEVADRFVRAVDTTEDTELTGYDGEIVQMSWDPSGSLVLGTVKHSDTIVNPDDAMSFFACDPATGDCELIDGSTTTVDEAPLPANFDTYLQLAWSLS